MISLLKTQEYSAVVRGTSQTIKVLHKDVAVEYFQSIDPAVTKDQVMPVKSGTSDMRVPVEYLEANKPIMRPAQTVRNHYLITNNSVNNEQLEN